MGTELEPDEAQDLQARPRRSRWNLVLLGLLIAAVCTIVISVIRDRTPAPTPDPSGDAKRVCQEEFIPKRLKAPATAEFSRVSVTSAGDVYTVTGSVDAQNSFGALVRSTFTCVVRDSGASWVLQSATVTG